MHESGLQLKHRVATRLDRREACETLVVQDSMAKPGQRETMRAEKEADVIMQSLQRASESVVATTLQGITDTLKGNVPLMYHIHALLQNDEWRGVLNASAHGIAAPTQTGDKPAPAKKLKVNLKKFEHLSRHLSFFFVLGFKRTLFPGCSHTTH